MNFNKIACKIQTQNDSLKEIKNKNKISIPVTAYFQRADKKYTCINDEETRIFKDTYFAVY